MRFLLLSQQLTKLFAVISLVILLVACSGGKIVSTYEGDVLPQESLAVLTASENISLLSVNGKAVPTYLLTSLETRYALKPGLNQVVFKYESVWARAGARGEDGSRSEKVESSELMVEIDTKAGESYGFSFMMPDNVREARRLAADLSVSVHDSAKVLVAQSTVVVPVQAGDVSVSATSPILTDGSEVELVGKAITDASVLTSLKAVWARASEKEKKAFLAWAFQE